MLSFSITTVSTYQAPSIIGIYHLNACQRPTKASFIPSSVLFCSLLPADDAMTSTFNATATSPGPSNFQLIFNTALKAYEKKTKSDLLAHPLASQLQKCDSPASILSVLQTQVDDLEQARQSDERMTKWLGPTINVLLAFSATLEEGVSLVSVKGNPVLGLSITATWQVFSPAKVIFAGAGVLLQVCIFSDIL